MLFKVTDIMTISKSIYFESFVDIRIGIIACPVKKSSM